MNDLLNIENKILIIRGQQVMLDRDLAEIYGYSTKAFNQQVKNNIEKFPDDMMFQLTNEEFSYFLRSKFLTSNGRGGNRYLPFVFTEQGIYMLMTVLKGDLAVKQSIALVRLFKKMRQYFIDNDGIINRLNNIDDKINTKFLEYDERFSKIFKVLDSSSTQVKEGVFIQGQIFDAYSQFNKLIQIAKKEIILIDNYIDLTVLDRLSKKNSGVSVIIYTRPDTPIKQFDIDKFNAQYPILTIKHTLIMHDRFLILDSIEIYHIGASIKDLGKKCFCLMKMENTQLMLKTLLQALQQG
ncbi:MAG: ORF6N domain-containing protein [Spirochaetia bacterium]|nr:ORF6N domain-containing protein [Spirochaetia bacterium]